MYDNVPLQDIQLTFSLLLAGMCQTKLLDKGFVDLDYDIQFSILKEYKNLTSKRMVA
jgi:hypothetical protein